MPKKKQTDVAIASQVIAIEERRLAPLKQPKCSLDRGFSKAVHLTASSLRKLDAALRGLTEDLRYRAELVDGSSLNFDDVEHLLTYDNPKLRAVRSLRIVSGYLSDRDVTVELSQKTELQKPVQLRISGPDEIVTKVVRDVEMWLGDVEENRLYSWFARQSMFSFLFVIGALLFIGIPAAFAIVNAISTGNTSLSTDKKTELTSLGHLLGWGFIVTPWVLTFALEKFRAKFWPAASFAFGEGEARYQREQSTRNVLVTALVLPIVIGIVFLFFS